MIGFLVGAFTKLFFRRMSPAQMYSTMTISLVGSIAGAGIGERLGLYDFGNNNSLIASLIGASICVSFYCYYFTRSSRRLRAFRPSRR